MGYPARLISRAYAAHIALAFVLAFFVWLTPVVATAAGVPHVTLNADTDSCAMCHRVHSSGSSIERLDPISGETTGNALIFGTFDGPGDTLLCLSCHGLESLGSETDVQTAFVSASAHSLDPDPSPFGPDPKRCGTCHDNHGTARDVDGEPYAALLRRFNSVESTGFIYQGDAFCGTCHSIRPGNAFEGMAAWNDTAHARLMSDPASGTKIKCTNCHNAHGSNIAPMITETLLPPAAPATTTVTANDRELCLGCHTTPLRTYSGPAVYATSGHGSSAETHAPVGEWVTPGYSRSVGACQNCHNPMGASDGVGGALPRMMRRHEGGECFECHNASSDNLDIQAFEFPSSETTRAEIAMVWDPERIPEVFTQVSVFAAETTGTAPRTLFGPREWPVHAGTGNASYGDIDGDGTGDLVVADITNSKLQVFSPDPMGGLAETDYALAVVPSFIEIADIIVDPTGLPEIAVITRDPTSPYTSALRIYRYNAGSMALIDGPYAVGTDATGITSGEVTGTSDGRDLAITSTGDQALRIVTEVDNATITPYITVSAPIATRVGPRGPSIGDAWDNGGSSNEIVIANSGETLGTTSVFSGAGTLLASYDTAGVAGAKTWDTLVADVVPQYAGAETIVALRHGTLDSSIAVYARVPAVPGPAGLSLLGVYTTGTKFNSASLAAGDVDADSANELLVGNAGYWGYGVAGVVGVAPSVQAFSFGESGLGSQSSVQVFAGGAEIAGGEPDVFAVDLGPINHSGHPHEAVEGVHVSTETAGFAEHAECMDCHNPHESTATVSVPPAVPGANKGTWGVGVEYGPTPGTITYTEKRGVEYEYELCYKCHSGWTRTPGSRLDVASQFDTRNKSFHSMDGGPNPSVVPPNTFVTATPAWTGTSPLWCTTCHTNADLTEPKGPHKSIWSPMLKGPYSGVAATDPTQFCFECHKYTVYVTGTEPAALSNFRSADLPEPRLHKLHAQGRGFTCVACHVTHGSPYEHLVRPGMDWVMYDTGGACFTPCHPGGTSNVYSRLPLSPPAVEFKATSFSLAAGTTTVSGILADTETQNLVYQRLRGNTASTPSFSMQYVFGGVTAAPTAVTLRGRWTGSKKLDAEILDNVTMLWVPLGRVPDTTTDSTHVYPVPAGSQYRSSPGNNVTIRLISSPRAQALPDLWVDRIWVSTP